MINIPKISVIVPVYGVEKYLMQCVDSLLCQTLQDIEFILIDDGGKDACPQIIDDYAQKDSRITALHKENSGYGATVNIGIGKARGEYVAIVEPDDFCDKDMFESLYSLASESNADIVKSDFYIFKDLKYFKKDMRFSFTKYSKIPQEVFTITECPELLALHPSIWSAIYRREFLISNDIKFKEVAGAGWTDNPFQERFIIILGHAFPIK